MSSLGSLTQKDAEQRLRAHGAVAGNYLFRTSKNSLVLSIDTGKKVVHNQLHGDANAGTFTINNTQVVHVSSIQELVQYYLQAPPEAMQHLGSALGNIVHPSDEIYNDMNDPRGDAYAGYIVQAKESNPGLANNNNDRVGAALYGETSLELHPTRGVFGATRFSNGVTSTIEGPGQLWSSTSSEERNPSYIAGLGGGCLPPCRESCPIQFGWC